MLKKYSVQIVQTILQAHQTNQDKHSHAHEGDAIIYFILIFWK